jgi:hypothetical protein
MAPGFLSARMMVEPGIGVKRVLLQRNPVDSLGNMTGRD